MSLPPPRSSVVDYSASTSLPCRQSLARRLISAISTKGMSWMDSALAHRLRCREASLVSTQGVHRLGVSASLLSNGDDLVGQGRISYRTRSNNLSRLLCTQTTSVRLRHLLIMYLPCSCDACWILAWFPRVSRPSSYATLRRPLILIGPVTSLTSSDGREASCWELAYGSLARLSSARVRTSHSLSSAVSSMDSVSASSRLRCPFTSVRSFLIPSGENANN